MINLHESMDSQPLDLQSVSHLLPRATSVRNFRTSTVSHLFKVTCLNKHAYATFHLFPYFLCASREVQAESRAKIWLQAPQWLQMLSGPKVIKLFSCSTQLSMKFQLLIKTKIPTKEEVYCFKSLRCCIYHTYKC